VFKGCILITIRHFVQTIFIISLAIRALEKLGQTKKEANNILDECSDHKEFFNGPVDDFHDAVNKNYSYGEQAIKVPIYKSVSKID